jgi:peptidoglycan/LPS O-acetylase OafA/YrhL
VAVGSGAAAHQRADIEGLRAVAVGLVLLYHAGLPPGHGFLGVDVFFVISGFLITGLLLREMARTGTVSWPRFVARRVRRLLPAAVLVLVATAVVAWFVVPGLRRHDVGSDVAAASVYVVNWALAGRAVDYLAADASPSPVQHYWSLSVEEQFYVVWPLLLLAATLLLRRLRPAWLSRGPGGGLSRGAVGGLLALVALPSAGWSLWLTATDPAKAYLVSTTRAWELGLGAALALWVADREAGRGGRWAVLAGWTGLALVLAAALWLPADAGWPGWWALVPTVGTAAALYAGWAAPGRGVARVLARRPFVVVGGLSYSLYLWHWPVRVLGEWAWPGGGVPLRAGLVAAATVPAWLGHRFVERPIHLGTGAWAARLGRGVRRPLVLGLALSLTGVLAGTALTTARSPFVTTPASGVLPPLSSLGAATLVPGRPAPAPTPGEWVIPDPLEPGTDRPAADTDHCQVDRLATEPVACTFGDPSSTTTVALVGDSKAMQWLPALQRGARQDRWRIVTFGKSSCAFASGHAVLAGRDYPQCDAWNAAVMRRLDAMRPDVVVTSANEVDPSRLTARWAELRARGWPVVVVGNNPVSPADLDVCAARHPRALAACDFPAAPAVRSAHTAEMAQAAATVPGVRFVDLTDQICPARTCPLVIGHVTVNRPGDHVTATYAATLAPYVVPPVESALGGER